MTIEYPDVMNDLTDARHRFQSGFVQYLAEFVPPSAPAGDTARLVITVQNTVNAPVHIRVDTSLPRARGKLRRLAPAPFEVMETVIRLTLDDGEVGQLTVLVRIHPEVPPDQYAFKVRVESQSSPDATRMRPTVDENQIGELDIAYPQGLGISKISSWGFDTTTTNVQELDLQVVQGTGEPQAADIAPQFSTAWMPEHWEFVTAARREVDERRPYSVSDLTTERVFASMFRESPMWFAECGIQLHVAEAVMVAKMLTYTVTRMLISEVGQDCLLVPIFAYALANEQPTGDILWMVTQLGYTHVLELAIASSFTLVEQAVGRRAWDATEQRAARDFIIESLNAGTPLPTEFLYLPLVLGGLAVAQEIVISGEDVGQTVGLLRAARATRTTEFAGQEWRDLDDILSLLLTKQESVQSVDTL